MRMASKISLNCDMGESFGAWTMGADAAVMPHIDMANIACGFHAGSPAIMQQTLKLAKAHNVKVGAHPAYPDLEGFGRRSLRFEKDALIALVQYQIGAMLALCTATQVPLYHVKPHGALYNDMQNDAELFRWVCEAVAVVSPGAHLVTLARADNSAYQEIAQQVGVKLLFEAFADRAYEANGQLRSRSQPGAVLQHADAIIAQVTQLARQQQVTCYDGSILELPADTICVHGDNTESIATVAALKATLQSL